MDDLTSGKDFEGKAFYIRKLAEIFRQPKPLAKMIRTLYGFYLYDTGTNKILGCKKEVYELFNHLFITETQKATEDFICRHDEEEFISSARDIVEAVQTENILKVKTASQFGLSDHFANVKAIMESSIHAMNLEVTQDCNLRCDYCIYHDHFKEKRNYGKQIMTADTAKKAIDLLYTHSTKIDPVLIGFYGGEPLMRFPFVRELTQYAKHCFKGKKLIFNITTNAMLITDEIARFLLEENFSVLVSMDGPEDIHDHYRKDKKGKGSFRQTMKGLRLLADAQKNIKKGMISVNVVYAPPFSTEKLETINRFIDELKWLPGINVFSQYPSDHSLPMISEDELIEDKNMGQWAFEKYRNGFRQASSMAKRQVEKRFASFLQRPVLSEPLDQYSLNGCCLPGQRKAYVTTDGNIHICEKMPGNCMPIGHVEKGLDYDTIQQVYIDDYASASLENCSQCWGIRLCDACYIHAFNKDGQFDMKKKIKHCQSVLRSLEQSLTHFVTLVEERPGQLNYLKDFEIT